MAKDNKDTWIKLYRGIKSWEWYDDIPTKVLFIELLLTVNIEDKKWHGMIIKRGQIVTSTAKLAAATGLSSKQIRRALNNLEKTGEVTTSRTNKYTLINVENYSYFQDKPSDEGKQKANKGQSKGNQRATTKEYKEYKEYKNTPQTPQGDCAEIINHLNSRTGTNYRANSKKTVSLIKARQNEGFTVEDFKTVIDKKCVEWMNTEWEKFLRPETLFGTKFENYLNAPVKPPSTGNKFLDLMRDMENGKELIKF